MCRCGGMVWWIGPPTPPNAPQQTATFYSPLHSAAFLSNKWFWANSPSAALISFATWPSFCQMSPRCRPFNSRRQNLGIYLEFYENLIKEVWPRPFQRNEKIPTYPVPTYLPQRIHLRRNSSLLRHLITLMRRHDLTKYSISVFFTKCIFAKCS